MLGVMGALLTGNRVRIKARTTRAIVSDLVRALDADCEVADWSSTEQDDRAVLDGIDGVVLAGGEELIAHYRRVTPVHVRLVEFGPKVSCAAIGRAPGDLDRLADALIDDVTLFHQGVCSSPQWIFVEDIATALALRERILARELPPLPDDDARLQRLRARELALRARLGDDLRVDVHASGWGVTIASGMLRLPKGFAFVVGPVRATRSVQVLGVAGDVPDVRGFAHRCAIGRMHERSPLAPHDGFFELGALVRFTSRDEVRP
jgi:hypothetical protein